VGISIYSQHVQAGGLIHIAMPDSGLGAQNPAAHADVAISAVVEQLEAFGAVRTFMEVKIAGGSNMFGFHVCPEMDIGARNIASVREVLARERLQIKEEDVVLSHPRTMVLDLRSGRVLLKTGGEIYRIM
jgi:chemotaxis protein CheD